MSLATLWHGKEEEQEEQCSVWHFCAFQTCESWQHTQNERVLLAYGAPFQLSSVGLENWLCPLSEAFLSMLLKD